MEIMVLPIVAYGDPVLTKEAEEIEDNYPELDQLIKDMYETMYSASGVGLAAPQVGKSIRLFIVDGSPFAEADDDGEVDEMGVGMENFKKVFINPIIEDETGTKWNFREGCLSIPGIREDVSRKSKIKVSYYDENWDFHEDEFDGYAARIIQHEYDHLEGVLFVEKIGPLKRRMLKGKLNDISKGDVDVEYKMRFPKKK